MAPQILTLRAIPLTPIHIGDGTELTPDGYKIDGRELLLFDPARVLAVLPEERRAHYLKALDHGQLEESQRIVREAVRQADVTGRIAISDSSAEELRPNKERSGRVHPFVRSGGRPFIPGSSIKGALRTALLDYFCKNDPEVKRRVGGVREIRAKHSELVRSALRLTRDDTADDPLRFLSVADAAIPDDATRIDPAIPGWRPSSNGHDRQRKPQIQLHLERLCSAAESGAVNPSFTLTIAVDRDRQTRIGDGGARWDLRIQRLIDWETVRAAANAFFWGRWLYERKQFFPGGASRERLDVLLRKIAPAPGKRPVVEAGPAEGTRYLILRIGRFSHFESLSVDDLREGDIPQKHLHRQPGEEGKNRTVAEISFKGAGNGAARAIVPFGWLLLYRQDAP